MNTWLDCLKAMKRNSKMTTKELSIQSNIPEPTLEKIFAGVTKDPKLETMRVLVHTMGYTLDDLDSNGATKKTPPITGEALEVAQAYEVAGSDIRRSVRKLLDLDVATSIPQVAFVPRAAAANHGPKDVDKEDFSQVTHPETSSELP